jgi:cytoskeletal protein RodZ
MTQGLVRQDHLRINMSRQSTLDANQKIGAALRDERIARGLSCGEISRDCKLQEVFVKAIEEGHTDYLPTHIYFRMFARLYADTLGIDPEQLLGKLYSELPLPEKPEFAGAVYRAQAVAEKRAEATNPTGIAPLLNSQSQFDMSGLSGSVAQSSSNRNKTLTRGALAVVGVLALFVIAKNTVLNNGFAEEDSSPKAPVSALTTNTETSPVPTIPAYQLREKLTLTIKAKPSARNAGIMVIADGDTLFNRKISGGEVYTWNSDYRFKLNISDKNQVEIFIGGQRLQTPEGSSKRITGFEITQLNYEEMLAPPVSSASTASTE